jgi:type VI secretion system secreted protein Hcp
MSIYLKIEGIDGPVTAQGLIGCIELESYEANVTRKVSAQPGSVSNREGTKPAFSEIKITKYVDKTTPLLFAEATVGNAKSTAVIKFINTGANLNEYLVMTLSNVIVSSQSISDITSLHHTDTSPSLKDRPLETITLNFTKIEVKYTPYDSHNNAGSPIPAGYDLETAQAQ